MACIGILPVVLRAYHGCADVHGNARALPCRHLLPPCLLKKRRRRVLEGSVREHDHGQWEGPDVMKDLSAASDHNAIPEVAVKEEALVWNNLKECVRLV